MYCSSFWSTSFWSCCFLSTIFLQETFVFSLDQAYRVILLGTCPVFGKLWKGKLSLFQHVLKQKGHNCCWCFFCFFFFLFLDCSVYACLTCTFISAFCYPSCTVCVCEFFIVIQGQYLVGRYLFCPVTDCTFMP